MHVYCLIQSGLCVMISIFDATIRESIVVITPLLLYEINEIAGKAFTDINSFSSCIQRSN